MYNVPMKQFKFGHGKKSFKHGRSGYSNYGCKCEVCVAGERAYNLTSKRKMMNLARISTPEARLRKRAYDKIYSKRKEVRARHLARQIIVRSTKEGKLRQRARDRIGYALEWGHVFREPCLICGIGPTQAHHWHGYEPKHACDVIWLCQDHHKD